MRFSDPGNAASEHDLLMLSASIVLRFDNDRIKGIVLDELVLREDRDRCKEGGVDSKRWCYG